MSLFFFPSINSYFIRSAPLPTVIFNSMRAYFLQKRKKSGPQLFSQIWKPNLCLSCRPHLLGKNRKLWQGAHSSRELGMSTMPGWPFPTHCWWCSWCLCSQAALAGGLLRAYRIAPFLLLFISNSFFLRLIGSVQEARVVEGVRLWRPFSFWRKLQWWIKRKEHTIFIDLVLVDINKLSRKGINQKEKYCWCIILSFAPRGNMWVKINWLPWVYLLLLPVGESRV